MVKKLLARIYKKLNNSVGASLAEMLVCVAFVGIISVLVTSGVVFSYRITAEIQSEAYADTVSKMILEKIGGVVTKAITPGDRGVFFSNDNTCMGFEVADAGPVIICATPDVIEPCNTAEDVDDERVAFNNVNEYGNGYLNLYYCQLKTGTKINPSSVWTFSTSAYMGYIIKELTFTPATHNGRLMVCIELTIEREDGVGEPYTETATVCCYNVNKQASYFAETSSDFPFAYLNEIWKKQ